MNRYTDLLSASLTNGQTLEDGLAQLRVQGATPVEAIKAISEVQDISLGEAKQVFGRSSAWAREVQVGDALHKELATYLSNEKLS